MLLYFPAMHSEKLTATVEGALFFDPGLAEESERNFRPGNLPLDQKSAKHLLNDCVSFGEQFVNPKEMAYFGAYDALTGKKESASVIETELSRRLSGSPSDATGDTDGAVRSRAQFLLLLAWALEERQLELVDIEQGVQKTWDSFGATLGVGDEEALDTDELQINTLVSEQKAPDAKLEQPIPWPFALEAVCVFLPEDATLVVENVDMIAAWRDIDLEFGPASDLPDGFEVAEAPAWVLVGKTKAPEDREHLMRTLRVAVPQ